MEAVKTISIMGTRNALWYNIKDIILKGTRETAKRKRMELDKWNEATLVWFDRRGNSKSHGTPKRIPAEAFIQEVMNL